MTTAIVPARIAQILPLEVFSIERGGRNAVSGVNGRVASDIELLELDEDLRIARYELRVANDSPSMLTCYAYAVRGRSGERPLTCTSIAVLPNSGVAVTFELPLPFVGSYDHITVELHGDGVDVSSDTIPPSRNESLLVRRAVALASAVVLTALVALVGIAQPQILAISAPSEALGGTNVHLAYEARGLGALSYDLIGPDGTAISPGAAYPGVGSVAVALPPVPLNRSYLARVEVHNIFGGDSKTTIIRDLATPVPLIQRIVDHPASIGRLSLTRPIVHSGDKLLIQTDFSAEHGTLQLLDDSGTVWGAMNVSKPGLLSLKVPHVDHDEALRVALHVERGATSADSQVGVHVLPATPPKQNFRSIAGSPVDIAADPLRAGQPIPLRVTHQVTDLHVSLQDGSGLEIEGFNIDGNQASLHAPARLNGNKYTVIVSFSDRNGQETVVTPITIQNSK